MRLVQGGGAANLQLIQALSDSEEEHDSAWDGRLGDRYNPPGKRKVRRLSLENIFSFFLFFLEISLSLSVVTYLFIFILLFIYLLWLILT